MVHAACCAEPWKKSIGGAAWACHDTCSVRSYRASGVLRNPRICAVVQNRRRRGGHLPQGSVGDRQVFRTRLRGVGRCRRRGKTWPDSTVASLSTATSRSRRTRTSMKPVKLELIVSKFALEIVPEDQHAARSMWSPPPHPRHPPPRPPPDRPGAHPCQSRWHYRRCPKSLRR